MSSRRQREKRRQERIEYMAALHNAHAKKDRIDHINSMTKAQLVEFAKEEGIAIDKSAKKEVILKEVLEAEK